MVGHWWAVSSVRPASVANIERVHLIPITLREKGNSRESLANLRLNCLLLMLIHPGECVGMYSKCGGFTRMLTRLALLQQPYKDVVFNRMNQDLRLSSAQAFMIQEPHWAGQAPSASVNLGDSARESRSNDKFCGLPIL